MHTHCRAGFEITLGLRDLLQWVVMGGARKLLVSRHHDGWPLARFGRRIIRAKLAEAIGVDAALKGKNGLPYCRRNVLLTGVNSVHIPSWR